MKRFQAQMRKLALPLLLAAASTLVLAAHANAGLTTGSFVADLTVSTPTNLSPAHGVSLSHPDQPIELTWDPVGGATQYEVQIATDADFDPAQIVDNPIISTPAYVPTLLNEGNSFLPPGRYYWRVRAYKSASKTGAWTDGRSFIRTWSSAVSGLTFHDDDGNPASSTELAGYLEWDAVAGAASYDVEVFTSSSFSANSRILAIDELPGNRVEIPHLPDDQYYWRVRAVDSNKSEGRWTAGPAFKVAWTVMDPTGAFPDYDATESQYLVGWKPVPGASKYQAQFSVSPSCLKEPGTVPTPLVYGGWKSHSGEAGTPYVPPDYTVNPPIPATPATPPDPQIPDTNIYCRLTTEDHMEAFNNWVDYSQIGVWNDIVNSKDDTDKPFGTGPVSMPSTVYWRVRPLATIADDTVSVWRLENPGALQLAQCSDGCDFFGKWLTHPRANSTAVPFRYHNDFNAPDVSVGDRCEDPQNPTVDQCLVQIGSFMEPGASSSGSSTMQFPVLRWNEFPGAGGYFVQIATDENFDHVVHHKRVPAGWMTSYAMSHALPDNSEGVGYFWRVFPCAATVWVEPEACGALYYEAAAGLASDFSDGAGALSFEKHSSIDSSQLAVTQVNGRVPLLQWPRLDGTDHYEVQLAQNPYMSGALTIKTTSHMLVPYSPLQAGKPQPLAEGTWYWRVRSVDVEGYASGWSTVPTSGPYANNVKFEKRQAAPTGLQPAGGSTADVPIVRWNSVHGASSYVVQYTRVPSFTTGVTTLETGQTAALLDAGPGVWYWRVAAVVNDTQGLWSSPQGLVVREQTQLLYEVSKPAMVAGETFFVNGMLLDEGQVAVAERVVLQQRGARGYVGVASQVTGTKGAQGTVRIPRTAPRRGFYRLAWRNENGRWVYGAPFVTVVRPAVNARLGSTTVRRATNFGTRVRTNRAITGTAILEARIDGRWTRIASRRVVRKADFAVIGRINRAGTFPVRVRLIRLVGFSAVNKPVGSVRVNDVWSFYGG